MLLRRCASAAIAALIVCSAVAFSQPVKVEYPGRPRYPEGLLSLRIAGGLAKYSGEFEGGTADNMFSFSAAYSIFPELSVALGAEFGNTLYLRRSQRKMFDSYEYQFGDNAPAMERRTQFSTYTLEAMLNFFPRQYMNGYLTAGVGATIYSPDDYKDYLTTIRSKNDKLGTVAVPLGLGADIFLTRSIALNLELKNHFLFKDDFDAFPSIEIRSAMDNSTESEGESNDSYFSLLLGVKWYVFENNDIDGDLLLNSEEEAIGTNPYNADTDEDGLNDYEEVRLFSSNPLNRDTDEDGLNDYAEVIRFRTNVNDPDTDADGLDDADEALIFHSNPRLIDTDSDGVADNTEVAAGTNPNIMDTDADDLNDFEELVTHKTNALNPDSDNDGLTDAEEVSRYHTNPLSADSDADGLRDYYELMTAFTDPRLADTDQDSLSDYAEVKQYGTNPLNQDTDGDGIPDDKDLCPLLGENINHVDDEDGCPDEMQKCPEVTYKPPVALNTGNNPKANTGSHADMPASSAARPEPAPGTTGRPAPEMAFREDTCHSTTEYVSSHSVDTLREGMILTLFGVNFELDKDIIRVESYPILEENLRLFYLYPELKVEIRGHTDSLAPDKYNIDLSDRRANAVKRYFVSQGIGESRIVTKGYGESLPIATNSTELGRAKNRRVEFRVLTTGARDETYWERYVRNPESQVLLRE